MISKPSYLHINTTFLFIHNIALQPLSFSTSLLYLQFITSSNNVENTQNFFELSSQIKTRPNTIMSQEFCMILLYDSLILILNNSFFLQLLQFSLCFLRFPIVFSNAALLIILKKYFSKSLFAFFLSSVFKSMYDFSQAF